MDVDRKPIVGKRKRQAPAQSQSATPQPPRKRVRVTRKNATPKPVHQSVSSGNARDRTMTTLMSMFPTGNANQTGLGKRNRVVSEDEVIVTTVSNSSGFNTTSYPVQPGVSFPWLSQQATQYQRWRAIRMVYYYRPTVTALAPAGNSGKVILSCNYQASSTQPTTRSQVEDTIPHADGMPSESIFLSLDCNQVTPKPKFIRTLGLPAGGSINDFDGGFINLTTDATPSAGPCGELRCRYVVELIDPVLTGVTGPQVPNAPYQYFEASCPTGTIPDNVYTPLSGWLGTPNNSGITISSGGVISLPRGYWSVTLDSSYSPSSSLTSLYSVSHDIRQNTLTPTTIFGGAGNGGTAPYAQITASNVNGSFSLSSTSIVVSYGIAGTISQLIPFFIGNTSTGTVLVNARISIRAAP